MNDKDSDVFSTIMAFEEILEVMPDDRAALESVANAYDELGDQKQAKHYAMRLLRVLLDEDDAEAAVEWANKLRAHTDEDPEATALIEQFEALRSGNRESEAATQDDSAAILDAQDTSSEQEKPRAPGTAAPSADDAVRKGISLQLNIADEMAFAWNLLRVDLLSDEDYSSVVQDLSDLVSEKQAGTVSVIHVLRGRGFRNIDKILTAVARDTYLPLVYLQRFNLQLQTAQYLPFEFIVHRGALPFEQIGPELLVALLNPYDDNLRKDVSDLTEKKCHWYLTTPESFDQAVMTIKELMG